ncbi:thiaminase II [Tellurirhabdus rosea]|uniref:thiaminase II n=1 Tax=Tellurirhabdus rosea TaxID=2674997 RepID=UPI002259750F|nr:thiaminase II [Tellurirhabdus rosea]
MQYTTQFWRQISPIYDAILEHGFVRELTTGTLPLANFQYYIGQDALYLLDFSRALAQLSVKAESADDVLQFQVFAENAIRVERALHAHYFTQFAIPPESRKMPACFAYTNFLLATTAIQALAVGAAAVLPCFWIYREVGKHIYGKADLANHPYRSWIDTYAGTEFDLAVQQMLAITERLAVESGPATRQLMTDAFVKSSQLEWLFWNDAYELRGWGI